jgi:hypothetical protein
VKYWVWDQDRKRAYVDRAYDTREEADAILEDLLAYYPEGHAWRRRLSVEEHESAERAAKRHIAQERPRADVSRAVSRAVTLPDGCRAVLELTASQARVLEAYVVVLTSTGSPPPMSELGRLTGIASKSVVYKHMAALESKGVKIVRNVCGFSPRLPIAHVTTAGEATP